jgi:glutathione synthase/RimK-type ligase-like ATP-grasp enzyme
MGKLRYITRVMFGASLKRMTDIVNQVHEKCGQNRVYTFLDMINCAIQYGAGYHDYLIFGFYDMNHRQRNTYMTRLRNKRLVEMLNDPAAAVIFDRKNEFDKRFAKYINREFLDLAETDFDTFARFMADKEVVFAKPNVGESGKGIQRLEKSKFDSLQAMFDYVKDPVNHFGVLEELLTQHHDLNRVYPLSINSYRIVTLVVDGKAHCVYATAKFGNEGKFVDNMENSGMCCPIDIETETIAGCAHTSKLINYDVHPYTGVPLLGYKLPFVKEAVELVCRAALEVKEMRYVGWDVCIKEDGPAIIEGNDYPGYDFWQLPEHTPDKIGLYPYYRKMIPGYK